MDDNSKTPVKRALLSVSDKTGLVAFGQFLAAQGVEILSTGGTAKALMAAGVTVTEVSDYTGFPEMMDGRVKTLHPKIHGGLLAVRDQPSHAAAMTDHDIAAIDLLVVNLYPFEQTVIRRADFATCIENIDIGGPAMIRSAAKNHKFVTVVIEAADYQAVMTSMQENNGATTSGLRRRLAATAFARTAAYDAAIATWFAGELGEVYPDRVTITASRRQNLRYGENPHQTAAFYVSAGADSGPGIATARQIQGKELSYNNLNDTNAAFELVSEFDPASGPAVAIIKHANPCGVARADNFVEAYKQALLCDSTSAFGGIVALNGTLDKETAGEISKIFTEVVIAPDADAAALKILSAKKNLRLLLTGGMADPQMVGQTIRSVAGGYLLQGRDNGRVGRNDLKVVTERQPTEQEIADLLFAFTVCKHVKSNAIIYVKNGATVGIGAGQMSRVD
ncbi:MAG: bifunctional phosphoribosylaminoimidazolecarboxamide formyltransferase/IMP cyclohydrolase, partial [Alphaproteobacteria bacterium]|nr:bifunctional phosphoribosylaminoimidazolecarboxamide formyltransferase/IMP cyclohydrolase [Alphaproteobacteria bacterium]